MCTEFICGPYPCLHGPDTWCIHRAEDGSYTYTDTGGYPRVRMSPENVAVWLHTHDIALSVYKRVFLNEATAIYYYHFYRG